jgi:hypothetical protein
VLATTLPLTHLTHSIRMCGRPVTFDCLREADRKLVGCGFCISQGIASIDYRSRPHIQRCLQHNAVVVTATSAEIFSDKAMTSSL